jgi:hypothetical protein
MRAHLPSGDFRTFSDPAIHRGPGIRLMPEYLACRGIAQSIKDRPMKIASPVAVIAFAVTLVSSRLDAAPPKAATEFEGTIKAITPASITVAGPKGSKVFSIYSGTVFGQRAAKSISDYKPGEKVRVVFSEEKGRAQAENIRNPDEDKKPAGKARADKK